MLEVGDKDGYAMWRRIVMAVEGIAEAERLVADWQPNPAECELNTAQSEN